jgi:aspartyl protease family protein
VQGAINDHEVIFLLDTGATQVAIPQAIAKALGLRLGSTHHINTANGTAISYDTMLDSISVGDIELMNVPASVAPGYRSDAILLGMSFLKHIEFTQRGDTLILHQ